MKLIEINAQGWNFSRPTLNFGMLQPMDQSVIKSLIGHYRNKISMELIESDGNGSKNMLDAMNFQCKAKFHEDDPKLSQKHGTNKILAD